MAVYSRIVYACDLFPSVAATHKRMPKYDLLFTILFAFLWLVAASAWAHGVCASQAYQRPVRTWNEYFQTVSMPMYHRDGGQYWVFAFFFIDFSPFHQDFVTS